MTNQELQDELRDLMCKFWTIRNHATKEQKEFYGIDTFIGGVAGSDGTSICDSYCLRFTLVPDDNEYIKLLEENKKIINERNKNK